MRRGSFPTVFFCLQTHKDIKRCVVFTQEQTADFLSSKVSCMWNSRLHASVFDVQIAGHNRTQLERGSLSILQHRFNVGLLILTWRKWEISAHFRVPDMLNSSIWNIKDICAKILRFSLNLGFSTNLLHEKGSRHCLFCCFPHIYFLLLHYINRRQYNHHLLLIRGIQIKDITDMTSLGLLDQNWRLETAEFSACFPHYYYWFPTYATKIKKITENVFPDFRINKLKVFH